MKGSVESWIYESNYERMPRDKLERLQEERLRKIVKYCYEKMAVYRRKFKEAPVRIQAGGKYGKVAVEAF